MAKGRKITLQYYNYIDTSTGAQVTRLTPNDVTCHRNYFYQKCFSRDGNKLLFGGAFDGPWNYYLLDLARREATQLTEGQGDNTFGGFLSPDDTALFYVKDGRTLVRVCLTTLDEAIIYQVPDEWVGYGTWVANSACDSMVGIEIKQEDWRPLTDWRKFHDFYFTHPCCRLVKVDLLSGQATTILQENRWLGHPIYRPNDDSTIAFCHEGPHDVVDARMWLINDDGTNMRKVKTHAAGESCTHEFWVPDGSALVYVSYMKGGTERFIYRADPLTLQNQRITAIPPCSHLMSNHDGSLMVGDGANAPADVKDAGGYKIENDPYLYIFDIKNDTQRQIARHDTSWQVLEGDRQVTHPHPSFTPDDKQVLFTSDMHGKPALYLATLPNITNS